MNGKVTSCIITFGKEKYFHMHSISFQNWYSNNGQLAKK